MTETDVNASNGKTQDLGVDSEVKGYSPQQAAAAFEQKYRDKKWTAHWETERDLIPSFLQDFLAETGEAYSLGDAVGVGSTALVLKVYDRRRRSWFAAKIPRPRLDQIANLIQIIRAEANKLWSLDHPNVARVHYLGTITRNRELCFYITDFVDGDTALNYVLSHKCQPSEVLEIAHQIASGLAHIHEKGLIHCDIKPGNILIDRSGHARIADLGFSKYFDPADAAHKEDTTDVSFTLRYAHPELQRMLSEAHGKSQAIAPIPRGDLRPEFDLYALGVTIEELRLACSGRDSRVRNYEDAYLTMVVSRLLKGLNPGISPYPGFTWETLSSFAYSDASELAEDLDRARGRRPIELLIPELDQKHPQRINVPGQPETVLTERVKGLLAHPTVRRLHQVRQLGFVDYIYPGGKHSRLEHSLGVYASTARYIRALYYDNHSPVFRSLVTREDMEAVLLAALLHDVGQYPLAHDLEEVSRDLFGHDRFSVELIRSDDEGGLADVIRSTWNIWPQRVARILGSFHDPDEDDRPSITDRILSSILDGPHRRR